MSVSTATQSAPAACICRKAICAAALLARYAIATRAPSCASFNAIPRPIPRLPPVTTATRFRSDIRHPRKTCPSSATPFLPTTLPQFRSKRGMETLRKSVISQSSAQRMRVVHALLILLPSGVTQGTWRTWYRGRREHQTGSTRIPRRTTQGRWPDLRTQPQPRRRDCACSSSLEKSRRDGLCHMRQWNVITKESTLTCKETPLGDLRIRCSGRPHQMVIRFEAGRRLIRIDNNARAEYEPKVILSIEGYATDTDTG